MKKNWMVYVLLALFTACGGTEDTPEPTPDPTPDPTPEQEMVRFSSNINPMSKATDSGFETGDEIGVFAFREANGFSDNGYAKNVKYIYNGSLFASSNGITYPSKTDGLAFYAIYPYNSSTASQYSFSVNADQSVGKNYTQSDLMTASTVVTTEDIPNLKFDHRLSNIIINLEFNKVPAGSFDLNIQAKRNASVNLITNSYTATGGASTVKAAPNGTNSFKLILPPQTISEGTEFANFVINGITYTWTLNRDLVFKSGIQYSYNVTVDVDTKTITFTGSINPWGQESDIESIIPPKILDKMKPYVTIYSGTNPPIINGAYLIDPMTTVYCEDQGNGGYDPGTDVISTIIKFSEQSNTNLTLNFAEKAVSGSSAGTGNGAFISGSGNNFTAYFDTEGTSSGISNRTALVVSGTKTSTGIRNLRYAFVMVEKGSDPEGKLMKEGVFRVFKDKDELAQTTSWDGLKSMKISRDLPDCMSFKKK